MMTIRNYTIDDDDAIIEVWEAATRLAHPFFTDDFIASERVAVREVYLPNTVTYVAEKDSRIAGFLSLIGDEVGAIFVQPEFQGTGLGRALMDRAALGRNFLEVEVFQNNQIGRPFYVRYGFEEMRRSVHDATGETLLRLRWER
jgi:putative acetyltransferase